MENVMGRFGSIEFWQNRIQGMILRVFTKLWQSRRHPRWSHSRVLWSSFVLNAGANSVRLCSISRHLVLHVANRGHLLNATDWWTAFFKGCKYVSYSTFFWLYAPRGWKSPAMGQWPLEICVNKWMEAVQTAVWDVVPITVAPPCRPAIWRPRKARYLLSLSRCCSRGVDKPEIFGWPPAGGTPGAVRGVIITPAICGLPGLFSRCPQAQSSFRSPQIQVAPIPIWEWFFFSFVSNRSSPDNDPANVWRAYSVLGGLPRCFQMCSDSVLTAVAWDGCPTFRWGDRGAGGN